MVKDYRHDGRQNPGNERQNAHDNQMADSAHYRPYYRRQPTATAVNHQKADCQRGNELQHMY